MMGGDDRVGDLSFLSIMIYNCQHKFSMWRLAEDLASVRPESW